MAALDKTAWEVLNATADDWENLEQIYHMVCFDFSAELHDQRDRGAFYLRPTGGAPLLQEIADAVCRLVEAGLLEGRLEGSPLRGPDLKDRSYVWRAWFAMTPQGRDAWTASEHAAAV